MRATETNASLLPEAGFIGSMPKRAADAVRRRALTSAVVGEFGAAWEQVWEAPVVHRTAAISNSRPLREKRAKLEVEGLRDSRNFGVRWLATAFEELESHKAGASSRTPKSNAEHYRAGPLVHAEARTRGAALRGAGSCTRNVGTALRGLPAGCDLRLRACT